MFVTQRTAPSALSRSPFVRSLCLALVMIECRLFSCLPLIVHHGARPVRACSLTARSTWLVFKPLINHLRACESGESPGIIIIVHRNGGSSGCRYPRSVCICLRLRCLDNSLAQLCARGRSPPTPRTYLLCTVLQSQLLLHNIV